jgi:hypothetical protein
MYVDLIKAIRTADLRARQDPTVDEELLFIGRKPMIGQDSMNRSSLIEP